MAGGQPALSALVAALAAAALGAVGPEVLARLPDRSPADGSDDGVAVRRPPAVPYAVLAAAPGLRLRLSVVAAVAGAVLGAGLGGAPDGRAVLPAYVLAAGVLTWAAEVDRRVHLLPDLLLGPAFAGSLLLLTLAAALTGGWADLGRAVAAAAALGAAFLLLALLRPADLGLGDVKLAVVLGLLLGWVGWGAVVVGAVLGFVVGGAISVVLLVTRRAGLRTAIPFGPPLMVGALLGVVWGPAVATAYVGA